jgi:hypothetical protein
MLKEIIESVLNEENWVQNVKTKWKAPEGTFSKDADVKKSAEVICKGHKGDLQKSVDCVNFFFNRCGENCKDWGEAKRKELIAELEKICEK